MFVCKSPCCVTWVLDEHCCPPYAVPHTISDYPTYYDALYYPEYYPSFFESPQNFCAWLAWSLIEHRGCCASCSVVFAGCVTYDSDSIVVTHNKVSVLFSLPVFEASSYTHCAVLRRLASDPSSTVAMSVVASMNLLPPCFQHSPALMSQRLNGLMAPSLALCASSLSGSSVHRAKAANMDLILHHFLDLHVQFGLLSINDVLEQLADVRIPPRLSA